MHRLYRDNLDFGDLPAVVWASLKSLSIRSVSPSVKIFPLTRSIPIRFRSTPLRLRRPISPSNNPHFRLEQTSTLPSFFLTFEKGERRGRDSFSSWKASNGPARIDEWLGLCACWFEVKLPLSFFCFWKQLPLDFSQNWPDTPSPGDAT